MGRKKVFLWNGLARNILLPLNILAIIIMLLVGYTDHIDPRNHAILSTLGLGMPIVIAINVAFLIFWLFFKKKYALIALAGFIVCWGPVRRYCPINFPKDTPKDAIKIVSFNVFMFNPWDLAPGEMNPTVEYLINSGADIICLQEAGYDIEGREKLDSAFASVYQYRDTVQKTGPQSDVLALYSRFPILHRERIKYTSKGNLSEAYILKINGEKVLLVNNHFETVGLSVEDKNRFHELVHGELERDSTSNESKFILGKLGAGTRKRAPQADAVAQYIAKYRKKGMSVIVCGDFNDSPISYTHRTVAKGLTDCYVTSGNGPGWSYHKSGIRVRIDNILCSPDWIPYNAKVDSNCPYSDHYPIICWLKKK